MSEADPARLSLAEALKVDPRELRGLTDDQFRSLGITVLQSLKSDRQENQLLYYKPVSDIAIDVWRCDTRYQCVGGGNGACLPLDAPVLMADGSWKALEEVQSGDMVVGVDPESRMAGPTTVTNIFRAGMKEVFKVSFSDGRSFRASADHQVPVYLNNEVAIRKMRLENFLSKVDAGQVSALSCLNWNAHPLNKAENLGMMECGDIEVEHPGHCYVTEDFTVVSNSKTETMLAKLAALATGVFPFSMDDETRAALMAQFRGPIQVRVVVESLTTTLHPIILPKLQYWQWAGVDSPGGTRGHWGWIPRRLLKSRSWVASWSEKIRILRHSCVNPDNPDEVLGESTWQFMAHNQDATEFASGDFHHILHDEPTKYAIWRENEARTMRVGGKMMMAMTWPDDPAIPVDWMFDKLYEPGQPGPAKDPQVSWFEMWTQDNPNISQEGVSLQAKQWDETTKAARLFGKPIRFSNRVHPDFTDVEMIWCRVCKKKHYGIEACEYTLTDPDNAIPFCHVRDFELHQTLPTICLLDPHPRKPHMLLWVQVDTWDDLWCVAEVQVEGEPDDVKAECDRIEEELNLRVVSRIGDRNMLSSPSGKHRDVTWQDEFAKAGLQFDLSDVSDVGRGRINEYLKVDPDREAPRLHFHPRCVQAIRQFLRFAWGEFKYADTRDIKQIPKDKDDDYPALMRYCLNANPTFEFLQHGAPVLRTR